MNKRGKYVAKASIIAALYTAVTVLAAPISYGAVQVRISEALTVLPYFTQSAIPGLFVGCLLANFFGSPLGIIDIVLGSTSTLLAAILTSRIQNHKLVPIPSIVVNSIAIPYVLWRVLKIPYLPSVLYVGIGQAIAVYGLGYPLLTFIRKNCALRKRLED